MKKTTGAVVGLFASGSLLLAVPILAFGAGTASASCSTGGAQAVDTAAVASQVKAILDGGDKGAVAVPGLDDPADQVPNAKTIQATGVAMNIPARGQVVALATALQESGLRNLTYGDRDSLGLFQQRPSQGWGTANEILDPVHSSTKFYEGLRKVSGWQSLSVTQAAQAVQRSGFPEAYAKWEPLATALQKAIEPLLSKAGGAAPSPSPSGSADTGPPVSSTAGGCTAGGDGTDFGTIPAGAVPTGYKIPADAPREVQTAIRWALGQLGTAYQWGGSCTDSHGPDPMGRCDCSSLMQQAYKAAGVTLTRTTYTQVKEGKGALADALQPGDLLFTEGTADVPEHVGMFIGQGLIIHAPYTGEVVRIATLASWKSQILATRRVV
ncbi:MULTISPECIES: C40 family peptidase [Streptomyces]|uniref:C40 family peptidase n=1 Tax=Streptomyces TaxID=1883 RepID=UPI003326E1E9